MTDFAPRTASRRGWAIGVVLAVMLIGATACQLPPPVAPPGKAVPITLRLVTAVTHRLRGNFFGAGPEWEDFSSPAVGDLTGKGEVVAVMGTIDGWVVAVRAADGAVLWRRDLGRTSIEASPAIARLSGPTPDVVVATMDGRIVVLDGPTGRVVRTMTEGAPVFCPASNPNCNPRGFFGTPAIGDIDGDGRPDIVASSYDHTLYAWKATGQPIFRLFVQDTVWSSPVIADIDGDGRPEVIVGGDIYPNNPLGVPAGGLVWAFTRRTGPWAVYPHYPKSIPGQTVWSTPAVADLNGDGHPDVVVGTGNNYPISGASQRVYAFDARSTLNLPGWPVATVGQVSNGPAVGDVLGNHHKEAAFASEGDRVYLRASDGKALWTACASPSGRCSGTGGGHGGVAMADLNGDGVQDVVVALDQSLIVYDGRTGRVETSLRFSSGHTLPPSGTPTIATVDGRTVIAIETVVKAGSGPPTAGDSNALYLFTTGHPLGRAAWPTFKRTPARAG